MNNFSNFEKKELRISNILEDLPIGVISFDTDGIIDFVNPVFVKMGLLYNLQTSSLKNTNIFEKEIIPGVSLNVELNELKDGYPFEKEIRNFKIKNGSEINLIVKGAPFYDEDKFAGGIIILEDLKVISESREDDSLKIESYKKISSQIADLFFIVNENGKIKLSSGRKIKKLTEKTPDDLNIFDIIKDLPDNFTEVLKKAITNEEENRVIVELKLEEDLFSYECLVSPIITKHKSKYLFCTFIDVTDKVQIEKLENRLDLFETVADVISDGIIGINAKGIINFWSSSTHSLTGFSEEETKGKSVWRFFPAISEENFSQLKEDLQQINFFKKQILINNKSGSSITTDALFLLGDNDNIFISLNFSSGEKSTIDFKALDENFKNLVLKSGAVVIKSDKEGRIEYVNPSFLSQLNYTENEFTGRKLNELLSTETQIDFNLIKSSVDRELILKSKTGEKKFYAASITPIYLEENLQGFAIYLVNQAYKNKEVGELKLFKLLFECIKEGLAVEFKGKIITANNTLSKMFKYSDGNDLVGKDILDLVSPNDVLKVAEYLQIHLSKKDITHRFEFEGKRRDGSTFHCELTPSSIQNNGNSYLAFIIRDVSEKKRAQQIIRESEEKYRNLIENIDDFLYTLERSRLFFNPVFFTNSVEKITGYTQSELLNDIKLLLKIVHPDDILTLKENLRKFSRSRSKMSSELEFRIINKLGNVVWIRNKISVARNINGEVEKVYGLVSDISLRIKAEENLQKTTQNLVKLNETKDRFISIISHDLRTPFSSILGFTDLLLHDDTLTHEERDQYVKYIQESSNAMLSLVNSLLDWTRLQTGRIHFEPERIEALYVVTKSINAMGGAAFQKDINISSDINENLFLYVDKDLISQVFNNLISNAIKFTKPGGSIHVSATPSELSRFYEFSVKDTGIGIRPEDSKKLFGVDTKFTTEGTAGEKGTGLGLSLVKEIIEKHGGSIRVESEPGNGTNFLFTLPVAAANILLIDSNSTDRILYSKILKHITSDYQIETVSNGKEALNRLSASTYALIITENKMPVMSGYDFALELKKLDMKVKPPLIVLSSQVDRETISDYNELGIQHVFQKPVNLSLFKQAVEKSLSQGLS